METELKQVERQIKATDRDQHQLLQWALKGFPENQVETENKRFNKARETLTARKAELETKIKASKEAAINVPNLERFIEDVQKRLPDLNFEGKRLALDMLGITVWLDGESVEITGTIDTGIVLTPSSAGYSPIWYKEDILAGYSSLGAFSFNKGRLRGISNPEITLSVPLKKGEN